MEKKVPLLEVKTVDTGKMFETIHMKQRNRRHDLYKGESLAHTGVLTEGR